MSTNAIFIIVFIIYVAFLFISSFASKSWVKDSNDYILAGREISTIINIFSVTAIGFAGTTITLAPGFTIQYGLLGGIGWGLIYSLCGLFLFGLLFSKFIRRCGAQTLPEFLEMRYDGTTRSIVAVTSVIGMCGLMANNIVSSVQTITAYTGWGSVIVTAIIFAIIIAFIFISGMWAVSITDFVQVILGIIIIPTVLILVVRENGMFSNVIANWPGENIINTGLVGEMPVGSLTYPSILNFIICFAAALVWGNNYYWMKIANCRNEKVARNAFMIAAIVLSLIFMIPLSIIGAYMGAFHADVLTLNGGSISPTGAYGYIASTLIPIFGSLAVIGAIAASVSTSATSSLGASAILTRDIYQRLINPNASPKKTLKMSKLLIILVGAVTFVLCQFPGGPTYLFAFANCWLVPPAVLLGLGAVWKKFNRTGAKAGALCGMISMAAFTLLDLTGIFSIGNYVYLATLGLIITLVAAIIGTFFGKPKYYGESDWEIVPNETNRKEVELTDIDIQILELLRRNHIYMADLSDYLGLDSHMTNDSVERLDQGGYIMRKGLMGASMYTFTITEKGLSALDPLPEKEAEMAKDGLCPLYLGIMDHLSGSLSELNEYLKSQEIRSMQLAAISYQLNRLGYIVEKGVFKRKMKLTDKGREALKKYA